MDGEVMFLLPFYTIILAAIPLSGTAETKEVAGFGVSKLTSHVVSRYILLQYILNAFAWKLSYQW